MSTPTITAVITAHDRVAFLPFAVRSAVEGGADEVVVVRNFTGPIEGCEGRYLDILCPTPDTAEKQCRGLEAARGDVVALLDDDDVWTPEKVPRVRELFGASPTLHYYDHAQRPIDSQGRPIQASHPELAGTHPERFDGWDGQDFGELVRSIWPGNCSSTSVRRSWAVEWIPAAREAGWSADLFWLVAALLSGRSGMRITAEPLTLLRLHDQNMSHARGATPEEFRARHRVASERFARANGTLARIAAERAGPDAPMTRYLDAGHGRVPFLRRPRGREKGPVELHCAPYLGGRAGGIRGYASPPWRRWSRPGWPVDSCSGRASAGGSSARADRTLRRRGPAPLSPRGRRLKPPTRPAPSHVRGGGGPRGPPGETRGGRVALRPPPVRGVWWGDPAPHPSPGRTGSRAADLRLCAAWPGAGTVAFPTRSSPPSPRPTNYG